MLFLVVFSGFERGSSWLPSNGGDEGRALPTDPAADWGVEVTRGGGGDMCELACMLA